MPSNDEIHFGDRNVPSKSSKAIQLSSYKRPKIVSIYHMFDVKGREGVDLVIASFFLHVASLLMQSAHPILRKWSMALMMDRRGTRHLVIGS